MFYFCCQVHILYIFVFDTQQVTCADTCFTFGRMHFLALIREWRSQYPQDTLQNLGVLQVHIGVSTDGAILLPKEEIQRNTNANTNTNTKKKYKGLTQSSLNIAL